MRILRLKLRGAIGIKKGLGLEEIEVDFTNFQAGLIALTGRNGSGKTTIMENLHPYRQMVSRDGSLQSHFYLKDSHRILEFEYNGKNYESRILIDALTNKSEAYLFENGAPINDGKLTTYDEAIEHLLGSPKLFFNSVFSGQKSKGIAELSAGDRRKLFYELLNLNSYEVYLEFAKAELRNNETKLATIEGEINALQQNQTSIDILEEERKNKLNYQAQLVGEINEIETKIDALTTALQQLEVKLQLAHEKAENNVKIRQEINALELQIISIKQAHDSKLSRYESDIENQKKLIERYKKLALVESKEKIKQALEEKKQLQLKLDELKTVASELDKGYAEFQKEYSVMLKDLGSIEKSLSEAKTQEAILQGKLTNIEKSIDDSNTSIGLIDKVPCDELIGKSCQFLSNAFSAKKNLDLLETEKKSLLIKLESIQTDIELFENTLTQKKQAANQFFLEKEKHFKDAIKTNNDECKTIENALSEINKYNYEKLLDEIKEADNQIKLCEQSIEGTHKLIIEAENNYEATIKQINAQIVDLNNRYDETILVKIEELNSEVKFKKQSLAGLKIELQSSNQRLEESKQEVAKLEQLIDTMNKNEEKIKKLIDSKVGIEKEIKDWTFLTRAFDKTGIPVLKLENSGIEITSIANELLSIFDNKFRIVFETTKLKADKKGYKESFDINIVEEDGVCEISNKSGGQQVWLETAIQLAISLVVRNQGRNIQTAFLDEKDGALDLDNAYNYIEMLRKAHIMSGVYNTFIITHRPELLDFIPQKISLSDGIIKCEVN